MKTALALACLLAAGACQHTPASPAAVAGGFVAALNAKDVASMTAAARVPFVFERQQWESARDGSGFVLGAAERTTAESAEELERLLRSLVEQVQIEGTSPVANPPPRDQLLRDPLGESSAWNDLDLVLFLRGVGDVEHIGIVGVHAASGTVRAFYVN